MYNMLLIIIEQSLLHLPLILGAYISFSLLKVPDLSIETAYTVGAIFGAYTVLHLPAMPASMALILIIAASCFGGALVGFVSSMLTQKGGFPHLLSSIVSFGLFHGINQAISAAYVSLSAVKNPLTLCALPRYPELCMLIIIGVIIFCCIMYLLRTQIGYAYAVYGDNPRFFASYGISTSYVFITGIMLANALAGISGYLFAQSNNFVELNMGLGKALLCITVLILGKSVVFSKKPSSIYVPVMGAIAYFALQQGLLKVGFNLKYFSAMQAICVMGIMLYSYYHAQRASNDNLGV